MSLPGASIWASMAGGYAKYDIAKNQKALIRGISAFFL